jgi:hypothetical protein
VTFEALKRPANQYTMGPQTRPLKMIEENPTNRKVNMASIGKYLGEWMNSCCTYCLPQ